MKNKILRRLAPVLLALALDAGPVEGVTPAPLQPGESHDVRWIQIAAEGTYKGHNSGEFKLDADAFAEIVKNFRAHPSYKDPRVEGVIAYDFSHASEAPATSGSVPSSGTPAAAWARELEVRQGPKGLELWALTKILEPALSYVRAKRYQWTSVCVWENVKDPISAKRLRWYLSSIAFTNDPFIQGMAPIAAGRGFDPYCAPSTPQEALNAIRELFELGALATTDEVIAELAKLQAYYANPDGAPDGVDVGEMVGTLRQIFNLPTLSGADIVFAEADALLGALAGGGSHAMIARDRKDPAAMNRYEKAVIALAARLKVKLSDREDEDVARLLLEAVDGEATGGAGALEKLKAILTALGAPDADAAAAKIADMFSQCAKLEALMPELSELRAAKAETDAKTEEVEVEQAMAAHRMPTTAKPALLMMRRADKAKFLAAYPLPTGADARLLGNVNTPQGGGSGGPKPAPVTLDRQPADPQNVITLATIRAMPGPNDCAKAIAYVQAQPEGKALSYDDACERGIMLYKRLTASESNGAGGHHASL